MFNLDERTLIIYADGSTTSNNIGGVGIRIISIDESGDEVINDSQSAGYRNVNSGQMEIIACTFALEEAIRLQLTVLIKKVIILSDSKYISGNYKEAMFEWSKNQWRKKAGKPVQDAHLWIDLIKQITACNKNHIFVDIQWIKGHTAKNEHNLAVDKMARLASKIPLEKMPKNAPITIFQPRKIPSIKRMEPGCVKMTGQRISIKILSCKLLTPQKLWCYGYEVISDKSPSKGLVDQIFSSTSISLDENKSYFVRFNSLPENQRIEKLYWEIK